MAIVNQNQPDETQRVRHRDYTFLGLTQSLCPQCRSVVPTKIIARGNRVYFRKTCSVHGVREDFICSDVRRYDQIETSLPAKLPRQTFVEPNLGCPFDCGLCSEHEQHTCIAVIELTDSCNLSCPMCYAASGPGQKHRSLQEIKQAIDAVVRAEGRPEVVQLSGGEPTLHPEFAEVLHYACRQPIDYVMINTNGIRLANDQALIDLIAQYPKRVEIYLQLDALDDASLQALRGQPGLLEIKMRALDRLQAAGMNVTLVSTLQGGINNSAPADLVDFAATRPFITGLSFQPATYSGRYALPDQLENRITFPDVIDTIANDSRNAFSGSDFVPLPCAHPNCHWISFAIRQNDRLLPIGKFIDARANLGLLANGLSFTRDKTAQLAKILVNQLACQGGSCCGSVGGGDCGDQDNNSLVTLTNLDSQRVQKFFEQTIEQSTGARDLLRITITSFLDVYNFDLRRVMKCCTHHVLPSGHVIPFCAYNVLYRDGTVPLPPIVQPQTPK